MIRIAVVSAFLVFGAPAAAGEAPPEPEGYRLQDYRSPTPATLKGAAVLTTEEAANLWEEKKAVFVDVMPQPPRPAQLPAGTVWRPPKRESIQDAIWLPNVGFGEISPETEAYFRHGLALATKGNTAHPIVLFCLRDCWMSWNAAKRALSYGYTAVSWFPDGSDGWTDLGRPLVRVDPLP